MASSRASLELLAPIEDVWRYVSEPHHLADWWAGVDAVEPDRRGFADGARWRVRSAEPSLLRRAEAQDTLVVTAVEHSSRFAFELVRAKVHAELALVRTTPERTMAELRVEEPFTLGFSRGRRSKDALARLYDLVQTGATL
jgi:uncharacterized protein YndB with AHSA1/START domain